MTSDTGAVARIVDGLREIVEREDRLARDAWLSGDKVSEERSGHGGNIARECLAVAEAQR